MKFIRDNLMTLIVGTFGALFAGWLLLAFPSFKSACQDAIELARATKLAAEARTPIPVWVLALGGLVSISATIYLGCRWVAAVRKRSARPKVSEYTEDLFLGITWKWKYGSNSEVINLRPCCLTCDTSLRCSEADDHSEYGRGDPFVTFHCDRCGTDPRTCRGTAKEIFDSIKHKIHQALKSGDWETVVLQQRTRND